MRGSLGVLRAKRNKKKRFLICESSFQTQKIRWISFFFKIITLICTFNVLKVLNLIYLKKVPFLIKRSKMGVIDLFLLVLLLFNPNVKTAAINHHVDDLCVCLKYLSNFYILSIFIICCF